MGYFYIAFMGGLWVGDFQTFIYYFVNTKQKIYFYKGRYTFNSMFKNFEYMLKKNIECVTTVLHKQKT